MLLPLPDGPMRATNSPAWTDRETPRSASTVVSPSGYALVRSRASRIGRDRAVRGGRRQSRWRPAGRSCGPRVRSGAVLDGTLRGGRRGQGTKVRSATGTVRCGRDQAPKNRPVTPPTIVSRRPAAGGSPRSAGRSTSRRRVVRRDRRLGLGGPADAVGRRAEPSPDRVGRRARAAGDGDGRRRRCRRGRRLRRRRGRRSSALRASAAVGSASASAWACRSGRAWASASGLAVGSGVGFGRRLRGRLGGRLRRRGAAALVGEQDGPHLLAVGALVGADPDRRPRPCPGCSSGGRRSP